MRIMRAKLFQRRLQREQIVTIGTARPVTARDMRRDLFDRRLAKPRSIALRGNVDECLGGGSVEKIQRRFKTKIAILFTHIEMIKGVRRDTVRHAHTRLITRDKRNHAPRLFRRAALIMRSRPKPARPTPNLRGFTQNKGNLPYRSANRSQKPKRSPDRADPAEVY